MESGEVMLVRVRVVGGEAAEGIAEFFGMIPPAVSLCMTNSAMVFAPAERGDHGYYKL
jgi:hypothetical protein